MGTILRGRLSGIPSHWRPPAVRGGLGRAHSGLVRRRAALLPPFERGDKRRSSRRVGILLVLVQGHFPRSVARRIKSKNAQVTIALSQSREKRELRGKPGLRIICSITCARGRRTEGGARDCLGWRAIYWRSSFGDCDSELIKDGC